MIRTSQHTGPAERICTMRLLFDRRLRFAIGLHSAQGMVATDAGHHDVTVPHLQRPSLVHV